MCRGCTKKRASIFPCGRSGSNSSKTRRRRTPCCSRRKLDRSVNGSSAVELAGPVSAPVRRLDFKTRALSAFVVLTNVLGNFSLSWGMKHQAVSLSSLSPVDFIATIFSPWVLLGTTLLVVWLLSRMTLLSWADLSYVLPVTSIGYVITTFLGKYFFPERIPWQRMLGTLLIVGGIILVGMTSPKTTPVIHARETER